MSLPEATTAAPAAPTREITFADAVREAITEEMERIRPSS